MTLRWIPKSAVLAMHEMLITEHGGAPGLLSDDLLESSLAAPRQLLAYGTPDVFELAAKYAASFTLNHPFQDGNKRIALTVAGVFLELNGFRLEAPEAEAVSAVLALSTRELDDRGFAMWLRLNSTEAPSRKKRIQAAPRKRAQAKGGRSRKRR